MERRREYGHGQEADKASKKRNLENKDNISVLRERMDRERNAIKEWMDKRRKMAELKSIEENGARSHNTNSPTLDNRLGGGSKNKNKYTKTKI